MSTKTTLQKAGKSAGCSDWKKCVDDFAANAEQMARNEPAKAAGIAVVSGMVLTILPVGRIVGSLVRLAIALLQPGLLLLGAVKLYEEWEKRADR